MEQFASYLDLLNYEREAWLSECDCCGECLRVCQILPYTSLKDMKPSMLQDELLQVLKGGVISSAARTKALTCVSCGVCVRSCPKGLNQCRMQSVIKGEILSRQPQLQAKRKPAYDLEDLLCRIQIMPSQMRWLKQAPPDPQSVDVLVFLGCYLRRQPEKVLTIIDILEKLPLTSAVLDGGLLCCGRKQLVSGNLAGADSSCRKLVSALKSFRPKQVVFWCGTCYSVFKHDVPQFDVLGFEVRHLTQFLGDHTAELPFKAPLNKTITPHDSCNLGHKGGDYTSLRRLLNAIPGVQLVEMPHNRERSICCGGSANTSNPEIAKQLRQKRMQEALSIGAEILVPTCSSCNVYFSLNENAYPIQVKSYITLLAEAMGIEREDRLKAYLKLGDLDEVMKSARPYIEASGYPPEEIRGSLSGFFNKLWAIGL